MRCRRGAGLIIILLSAARGWAWLLYYYQRLAGLIIILLLALDYYIIINCAGPVLLEGGDLAPRLSTCGGRAGVRAGRGWRGGIRLSAARAVWVPGAGGGVRPNGGVAGARRAAPLSLWL